MSKKITQEEFEEKVKQRNKYIKPIGNYIGCDQKVDCQCLLCGDYFQMTPSNIYAGKKHNVCARKLAAQLNTKTQEQFISEMANLHPDVTVIGDYIGAFKNIQCRCNIHNVDFYSSPTHLLKGKCGCQKCRSEKIGSKLIKNNEQYIVEAKLQNPDIKIRGKEYQFVSKMPSCFNSVFSK